MRCRCSTPRLKAKGDGLDHAARGRGSWLGAVGAEWTAPACACAMGSWRCACGRPAVAIRPGGQAVARPSRSHSNRVVLSRSRSRQSREEGSSSNNESANGSDRRQFTTGRARSGDGRAGADPMRNQPSRPHSLMHDSSQHVRVRL